MHAKYGQGPKKSKLNQQLVEVARAKSTTRQRVKYQRLIVTSWLVECAMGK